jgi:hydrogenase maturation protein HypF
VTVLAPPRAARRARLRIAGTVQGVGFRPFVYRLASEEGITGWVANDPHGVAIEAEGDPVALDRFLERLRREPPPLAAIDALEVAAMAPAGDETFVIRRSRAEGAPTAVVLPDIATCADCRREVLHPADRRHGYPFTNCTNCGPRFTIIEDLPYDRSRTTMRGFDMCPACAAEYGDPADRRFHAQPNACPLCGPSLALLDLTGKVAARGGEALRACAGALRSGRVVAVKALGGFQIMADARDAGAISRLRDNKPRRDKPFALMAADLEQAATLVRLTPAAAALLESPAAPIVILERRPGAPVAPNVAPGMPTLGVMLPAMPLQHLLLGATGRPVIATSGNLRDEPICTDEREALHRLAGLADLFLVHDRPIARHVDDSVAWIVGGVPRLLRRARGYAPLPVRADRDLPPILAVGAHLKNSVALAAGRQVFLSQHIGDLETPEALRAFERVIADFLRLYGARPVAVAHDLHPDYLSTRWARGGAARAWGSAGADAPILVGVQHHHAHLAACLLDNGVGGSALGVTWDGTGYGTDGTVWGGEFLLGGAGGCRRIARLRPFRLPGGEAAVREPRRPALALLWELFGEQALERDDLAPVRSFAAAERRLLGRMLAGGLNAPVTSSMGRLFDGVAALLGLRQHTTWEGQAAAALEHAAAEGVRDAYPLPVEEETEGAPTPLVLDWRPLVAAVLHDLRAVADPGIIAARFHNALVEAAVRVAALAGEPRVALTGGCFQNRRLLEGLWRRLEAAGFDVLLHRQVPPNDGGISLGQIAVAAVRLEAGGGGTRPEAADASPGPAGARAGALAGALEEG